MPDRIDAISCIAEMLAMAAGSDRAFPATDLYNEGWMLRLVLHWFSQHSEVDHELAFAAGATWFSEARLRSAFLARHRGDKLAESFTCADGVIGQISIGNSGVGDLVLKGKPSQFVVTEAKIFSKLSSGVTNARYYDQAARNVACMAAVLKKADVAPNTVPSLGFFVIAPKVRIDEGVFDRPMNADGMRAVVRRRVDEYGVEERLQWYDRWFVPTLEHASVRCIAWEAIIETIRKRDSTFAAELDEFYGRCLDFNRLVAQRYD